MLDNGKECKLFFPIAKSWLFYQQHWRKEKAVEHPVLQKSTSHMTNIGHSRNTYFNNTFNTILEELKTADLVQMTFIITFSFEVHGSLSCY